MARYAKVLHEQVGVAVSRIRPDRWLMDRTMMWRDVFAAAYAATMHTWSFPRGLIQR